MHHRFTSSISSIVAVPSRLQSVAGACAVALVLTTVMPVFAETGWTPADRISAKAAVKKKKKTTKRLKASAAKKSRRMQASTGSRSRLLAQNDLEADFEGDLDAELGREDDALGSAPLSDLDAAPPLGEPMVSEPAVAASIGEDIQILDIQYDSKKNGGTVVISATGAATYRTREIPAQNQVVVEIANAKLPEHLKRPFNTKDFRQAIVSINAYQETGSNTARVVLQFRQPRSVDVQQNGQLLNVSTSTGAAASPAVAASEAAASAAAEPNDFDAGEADLAAEFSEESLDGGEASDRPSTNSRSVARPSKGSGKILPSSTLEEERAGEIRFYGKAISIEVRDTPVRDVITLISEQSGANIIMSDDIQGNITIKLRQIPWDQALSIIMKTRSLGYVRQGGVLRIAPIRQLQAETEEARRIIEAQEATLPLRVKVIPVSFASVALLSTQIRSTLQGASSQGGGQGSPSSSRGRIEADARSSSLIITDTDDNIKRIEQLVRALDTAPLQVMIEGKIVEAKEEAGRRLGINWGYQGQDLGFAGGTLSHSARITPTISAANTTLDLKLGTLDFLGDLNAKLSLFESESVAKIISSPRVITMNAQQATIEQSVNIAVPTTTITTGAPAQTSITYKAIPTTLQVTPQITAGGDVLMNIAFRREFQSGASGAEVAIESRDIKTNVMVKNGQTTVIGGIYQSDQSETEEGTPFLRKVPVLGWLFKTTSQTSVRNELLVFITPRILNSERTLPKAGTVQ